MIRLVPKSIRHGACLTRMLRLNRGVNVRRFRFASTATSFSLIKAIQHVMRPAVSPFDRYGTVPLTPTQPYPNGTAPPTRPAVYHGMVGQGRTTRCHRSS